jgi:Na+-driven multidrug efflux pump
MVLVITNWIYLGMVFGSGFLLLLSSLLSRPKGADDYSGADVALTSSLGLTFCCSGKKKRLG